MNIKMKLCFIVAIAITVSLLAYYYNEQWVLLFYSTILALFPNEIKEIFKNYPNRKQIRLSYSYLFRIEVNGNYLLVKDEQGRNQFHPVGGAYKYYPEYIDLSDRFEGIYDSMFNSTLDTLDDLRIIIPQKKLDEFNKWFSTQDDRENIKDLNREFSEELIDTNILPETVFNEIKYQYIGSYTQKSYNQKLHMKQIRHFDVFSIKLSNSQKKHLNMLLKQTSEHYLFANKENILSGYVQFAGNQYSIAEYTKLILVDSPYNFSIELGKNKKYTAKTRKV